MKPLEPESFRPRFGIGLTIAIGLIAIAVAVAALIGDGFGALLTTWPWLALIAGGCWAVFYNPRVDVDDAGVRLVNVWHTVEVPWGALIGIETQWALTLVTADRRYRAWAAPAPGRTAMRGDHPDTHRLREAAVGGEIRPGDMPNTDSGEAAAMVRKHWRMHLAELPVYDDTLEAPADDERRPDRASATRELHVSHLITVGALAALAVIGVV